MKSVKILKRTSDDEEDMFLDILFQDSLTTNHNDFLVNRQII